MSPVSVVAVDVPACPRRLPPSAAGLRGVRLSVGSVQGDRPVRLAPACLAGPVAHL